MLSCLHTVDINSANGSYSIRIERGSLEKVGKIILEAFGQRKVAVISDRTVFDLYGHQLMSSLAKAGFTASVSDFPAGEASKTLATVEKISSFLAEKRITRTDLLLALGGGVVGDTTGFAASIYLRGIRYVQIPTTLLAAVDASVGGKTGVDLPQGKNLVGTFWQPSLVLCDPDLLRTLPAERFSEGIAESIKHGFLADPDLFNLLETADFQSNADEIIARNVQIKAEFVQRDPFDNGDRQLLNFGHTFGHAIEKKSDFKISHGVAVAIGMVMATRAAMRLGLTSEVVLNRLTSVLKRYDLPTSCAYSAEALAEIALGDKKRRGKELKFVLPHDVGNCVLYPVPIEQVLDIFRLGAA